MAGKFVITIVAKPQKPPTYLTVSFVLYILDFCEISYHFVCLIYVFLYEFFSVTPYNLYCYYSTQFEPVPLSLLHLFNCVHKSLIIDVICVVVDTVADSVIAIHILHHHFVRNLVV